ncbi:hypothetical protein C4F17_26845 [Variovorax sp. PMC12]|nr:hypothetical protein C4F17_26845 [Variovorax sp. PMC12]
MKRTPWPRPAAPESSWTAEREERLATRAAAAMTAAKPRHAVMARPPAVIRAIPKTLPQRSEPYLRLVAALPCAHCGLHGHSQAAHANKGKAKGGKTDDRTCFPLCADRPGVLGCHTRFDQYKLFPRELAARRADEWGHDTRQHIESQGLWPVNLPKWRP